jgi:hypothetical protein
MSTLTRRRRPRGVGEGQRHRRLAAHAVTDQGVGVEAQALDQPRHVLDHVGIGHGVGMGRAAVIAQIHQVKAVLAGKRARHRDPVAPGAEQAVQDHHRGAVAHHLDIQIDRAHGAGSRRWGGMRSGLR